MVYFWFGQNGYRYGFTALSGILILKRDLQPVKIHHKTKLQNKTQDFKHETLNNKTLSSPWL